MSLYYSEKAHEQALATHSRRWDAMHELGRTEGHESEAYRQARQDMLVAHRIVQFEARRPRRRGRR